MNKAFRCFALCLSVCIAVVAHGADVRTDVVDIKPEALLQRKAANDTALVVLDVRAQEEYAQGHVPGAINIPHDQLANRIAELKDSKQKDIVLYCRSGRRAGLAADTLKANGFEKLLHLEGDIQKWTEADRPLEK